MQNCWATLSVHNLDFGFFQFTLTLHSNNLSRISTFSDKFFCNTFSMCLRIHPVQEIFYALCFLDFLNNLIDTGIKKQLCLLFCGVLNLPSKGIS